MKALSLQQYKQLELIDMPVPEIGPGDVLVRVATCGICGSDVHGFDGSTGRRIPPIVMGHEAAGVVAHAGADVRAFREGDRVTFDSTVWCGECFYCRRGEVNLCDDRQVLGVSPGEYRRHGAFAEYVAVPQRIVYRLPDELSFEHAAMIEAVSVAVHAVAITPVRLNDTAVVVGSGMIGMLAIQALKAAGCRRVIAVEPDPNRRKLAREAGADEAVNPETDPLPSGADIAIEAVGATTPVRTAIQAVRKGGAVTLVGNMSPSIDLPLQSVVTRQIRLQGSCASAGEYPACIALLARGAIRVDPLISAVAPLEEGIDWFGRLYRREPNLMKVILKP